MPYEVTRNGEVIATYSSYRLASYFFRRQPMRRDGADIWKIVKTKRSKHGETPDN